MAQVVIKNIVKRFGNVVAVDGLSLDIQDREFLTLLGPSGCGKTTTLNMIAGLEELTEGAIHFDGEEVSHLPPERRDIAMVFQTYALYPHMTVLRNITFGLLNRGIPRKEAETRAKRVAERLEIGALMSRRPRELSGGQRQRVALARAIVREPRVFLLDEPLSNLDAKLRVTMRTELKRLHYELEQTFVYVTHDQAEALTLSDRIAVMNLGKLQQLGPPDEIYNQPANEFVAAFMGSPPMNFFTGSLEERNDGWWFVSPVLEQALPADIAIASNGPSKVRLGIRPEDIEVTKGGTDALEGKVLVREPVGSDLFLTVDLSGEALKLRTDPALALDRGDPVRFRFNPAKLHLFDGSTGVNLRRFQAVNP